ncbi:MAG: hypothetical protein JXR20_09655 [Balneola sp.]
MFFTSLSLARAQSILYNRFDVLNHQSNTDLDSNRIAFSRSIQYQQDDAGDYFSVLAIYSHSSYNSEFAQGFNDGYLWQGRGFNQSFSFGIQGRAGNFEYTLAPVINYNQNRSYDLRSNYGSNALYQNRFTRSIDYVMQYGNESNLEFYLGQSEIAYSIRNIRTSLSTQNTIWGPGIFNQGLMSNNANGFPYLQIGSEKPWQTRAGKIEIQWVFGTTKESDYLNNDPSDDYAVFNGFVFGYQPSFFPGLSVSLQRSYQQLNKDRENALDYFSLFTDFLRTSQTNSEGTVTESADQMVSFGLDWRSKNDDFKVYLEWIRGDFASDIMDLLAQPEHNGGFIWGFAKKIKLQNEGSIRFVFENANLAVWETARLRSSGSLYQHGKVTKGYTNNGQVLGAAIGPGSSFHSINIAYTKGKRTINFEYFRTRYNDDIFYLTLFDQIGNYQDIQHYVGIHWKDQIGMLEYQVGGAIGMRDDYLFTPDDFRINLHPQMILRYHIGGN